MKKAVSGEIALVAACGARKKSETSVDGSECSCSKCENEPTSPLFRKDGLEDFSHRTHLELMENLSHAFPQGTLADTLLPRRRKLRTTDLLRLIHQEGEHHQQGQHHRQILMAMAVIMLEVVTLVFQRVECFVFDLPTTSAGPHPLLGVLGRKPQQRIEDVSETSPRTSSGRLRDVEEVDQHVAVRLVQRHALRQSVTSMHAVGIDFLKLLGQTLLSELLDPFEQERVTVRFDANDPRDKRGLQVADDRRVGVQGVECGDYTQVRMVLTKLRRSQSFFVSPSCLTIGSGISGMTSLTPGQTNAAPSI